jgi:hypothetical protein
MENLAKAIVDGAQLLGQVFFHFSTNQVGPDLSNQASAASMLASIIGNLASFVGQLILEIAKLIH